MIKTSASSEKHISNTERQGIDVSKPHECGLICSKSTHTGFQQGAAISEEDSRVDCNLSCGGQELLECTHQQHNPIKNRSVDKVAHVTTNNEGKLGPDSCYNNIKNGSVDLEHDYKEMDYGEMSPIVDEAQRGPQASHGTLPRATEKKQTESEIVPMMYINSQLASPEGDSSVHDESGHSEFENSIIHGMKAENSDIKYEEIEAMPVAAKYEDVQALPVAAKDKSKAHFRIQSVAKKRNSEKQDSEIKYEEIEAMPVAAKCEDVQALPVAAKDKSKAHFRIQSVAKKRNSEKRDSEIKYVEIEATPVTAKYEDVQALPVAAKDKSKAHFRIQSVAKKRNSEKQDSEIKYEEIEAMPVAAKCEDVQALPVAAKDKSKAHFRIQSVAKKRNSEKRDSEIKYVEIEATPVTAKYEDVQALPVAAKDKSKAHFRIQSVAKKRNSKKQDSEIKYEEIEAMPVAAKCEDVQALPVAAKDKSKAHFRIQSVAKKRNSEKRDSEIKYEEIEAMPVAVKYEVQALPVAAKDKSKAHFRIQSVAKKRNSEKRDSEMKVPVGCRQSTSDQISLNSNSKQEYQSHALSTAISAAEYEEVDTLPVPTKDLVTADLRLSRDGRKQTVTGVAKGPIPTTKFKPLTAKQKKSKFGVDDGETYKNTSLKSISASIQSGEYGSLHQRSHSTSPTSVRKLLMHAQRSFPPERVSPTSRLPGRTDFSRIDTPDNLLRKNIEPWDSLRAKSVGPSSPVESHVNRSQPWLSVRPMMATCSDGGVMVSSSVPDLSHEYVDEDYINTALTVIESRHNNALAVAYRNTSGGGASSASPEYVDEDYINTALSAVTDVTSPTADSHDKEYINAPQLSSFPTSKEKEDDFEYDYTDLRNTRIVIPPRRLTKVTTSPTSRRDDKEFHYPLKWNTDKASMKRRDLQFDKNESESEYDYADLRNTRIVIPPRRLTKVTTSPTSRRDDKEFHYPLKWNTDKASMKRRDLQFDKNESESWKTQSLDATTREESDVSQDDPDYILGYVNTDCKRQLPCRRSKSNSPQSQPFKVEDDLDYDYTDLHRSVAFKGQELTKPPPRKRTMKRSPPSDSAESFTAKSLPSWWLQLTAQRMAPQERDRSNSEVVETQVDQQLPPRNILRTMSQRRQSISLGKNRKQSRVTGAESDYYITIAPAQCTIDDNYINWEMIYSGNKHFSQVVSGEREEVLPPRIILRSGGSPNRVYSVDDMDILYVTTPPLQPLKLEPNKLPPKVEPKLPPKPEPIVPPKPVPKLPPKQQPNLSMKPLPKLPTKPELGKSSQERTDSGLVNQSYSENQAKLMPTRMLKPPPKEAKEVNPSDVKQLASAPQNLKPVAVLEHFI